MTKDIRYYTARFFILLLVLQPIIDVFTNLNKIYADYSISVGIIVRIIILFVASLFIIKELTNNKNKICITYLFTLGIYLLINFFVSYTNKPIFNYKLEITMIIKAVYPIIMFLAYLLSVNILLKKNTNKMFFVKPLIINLVFINFIFLIAKITGTGIRSYGANYKIGHSAWFFSGNEIGNILAMLFPIIIILFFSNLINTRNMNKLRLLFYITIFSMLSIGTKVGSFSILITLIIINMANIIIKKSKKIYLTDSKTFKTNRFLLLITMIAILSSYSYLPSTLNSEGQHEALYEQKLKKQQDNGNINTEEIEVKLSDVIDSGRSNFNKTTKKRFQKSPIIQKIFGMGYAGNYKVRPKIIEKDFHDNFYQFGVLGFLILYSPFIYIAVKLIYLVFKDYLIFVNIKYIMLLTSISLATAISFSSGHVFYSPSVSIYFSYLLAYIYSIAQQDYINITEKKRLFYEKE